jgi:TIR domain
VADIFVSYTSSDRDWAFWIGQQLQNLGHTPHIDEWEISAGGNIAAWMEERHDNADHILCVVSSAYLTKDYSSWERQAAQWAAASDRPNFALPVFIENCKGPTLLRPFKRCDLCGVGEEDARARLAAYLAPAAKPAGSARFPGETGASKMAPGQENIAFPGSRSDPLVRQPCNLPFASLGSLFAGRDSAFEDLRATLAASKGGAIALCGLGGVGKTRLAIEYAWRHEADYSALLFVRADDPGTLDSNLAALVGAGVLDLKEKSAPRDAVKIEAALGWLNAHPTWLMILDNVDDEMAVAAVIKLMARLRGGHGIVTARASNFPAGVGRFELSVLDEDAATSFLIERSQYRSRYGMLLDNERAENEAEIQYAREIARELGGLALGLEQAGAYIATERVGFWQYLGLWRDRRATVVAWFDRMLMSYDHDTGLAATWATSAARLSPESRRLFECLAMLAPDPIPDSLIDVAVPGEAAGYDAQGARQSLRLFADHARDQRGRLDQGLRHAPPGTGLR